MQFLKPDVGVSVSSLILKLYKNKNGILRARYRSL